MARMAAFRFTARDDPALAEAVRRHVGARRFAWNRCLQAVKDGLDARQGGDGAVPWTGFSLINWWNRFKVAEEAGRVFAVGSSGEAELVGQGLSWRHQVCAQVSEEAAVDLGRALAAFSASTTGGRGGQRVGFPRFQKKGKGPESFRLRNKLSRTGRPSIRLGDHGPRSLSLPVLGTLFVREDTRRLRRLLRDGRGRICFVTVSMRRGRIVCTLTCELPDLHPGMRHPPGGSRSFVGVDRGLAHLVVLARSDGTEIARVAPPRHLAGSLPKIARASRTAARKGLHSANRKKANVRLARLHGRVADQRKDFTHRLSTQIAKTHGAICLEDLAVRNLMKNRHLSRAIHDAAWGELGYQLGYKADWYGATLVVAPRFFPSTRTCASCGWHDQEMTLSDRVFSCGSCGLVNDRDVNAAANLAAWGEAEQRSATQAPDPQARGRVNNAGGGRSAGRHHDDGGTAPAIPEPGKKQEPVAAAAG